MRLAIVVACLVSLALVTAGCAGDDENESAAEWAAALCAATRTWGDEIDRIGDDVSDLTSVTVDTLESARDGARMATDDYTDAIRDLGAPPTASGNSVEAAIEDLADELDEESAEIEDAVDDATGVAGGPTAAREISASMAAMFTSLGLTLESLEEAEDDAELEQAFDDAEACEELDR